MKNFNKLFALYFAAILLLPIISAYVDNDDNLTFNCAENVSGKCLIGKLKFLAQTKTKVRVRRSFMNSGKCAIGYRWVFNKCVPCGNPTCDTTGDSDY